MTIFPMQPFCKLMGFIPFFQTFTVQTPNKLPLCTHMVITYHLWTFRHITRNCTILHTVQQLLQVFPGNTKAHFSHSFRILRSFLLGTSPLENRCNSFTV